MSKPSTTSQPVPTPPLYGKPMISLLPPAWGGPFLWVSHLVTGRLRLIKADDVDTLRENGVIL